MYVVRSFASLFPGPVSIRIELGITRGDRDGEFQYWSSSPALPARRLSCCARRCSIICIRPFHSSIASGVLGSECISSSAASNSSPYRSQRARQRGSLSPRLLRTARREPGTLFSVVRCGGANRRRASDQLARKVAFVWNRAQRISTPLGLATCPSTTDRQARHTYRDQ